MYVSNKLYGRFPLGRAVVNGAGKLLSPPFGLPSLTQNPPQTPPAGGAFFCGSHLPDGKGFECGRFFVVTHYKPSKVNRCAKTRVNELLASPLFSAFPGLFCDASKKHWQGERCRPQAFSVDSLLLLYRSPATRRTYL